MNDLALTIRALREGLQLTQEQLAKALGVSRGAVSSWEIGLTSPRGKRLQKLAQALGVTPPQLMAGAPGRAKGNSGAVIAVQFDGGDLPLVAVKTVEPALWAKTKQGILIVQEKSGRRFGILATAETIEALEGCLQALRELLSRGESSTSAMEIELSQLPSVGFSEDEDRYSQAGSQSRG